MKSDIQLDIVMPVYNEAEGISDTIWSLYREVKDRLRIRFIVSEDGSTDRTKEILEKLQKQLPMVLLSRPERGGYSRGILHGLRVANAPYILCIDSDGQYDPKDFWRLWNARTVADVIVGYRKKRIDSYLRLVMSRLFYYSFYLFFPKNIHDPSCSYILFRKRVAVKIVPILGLTNEGFWWEFMIRVSQQKFSVQEQIINHRSRKSGNTKIYSLWRIPIIGLHHLLSMMRIILYTEG